ncbi:HlyD family efflux transporter periplasmic adaptor subunit [Pedobacter sp. V48]|uniref:HlyD family efflux transporter periplasmic adaptor subunit n=1 Tax=Pedobacter sp. V48 TaxID=509635 RepID=UPI0003E4FF24|nr:HlyD family efflux transporter periplasmic adaptor subunit [Pedobacter sp. V48]ETZ23859.1 hypothetical protein N824_15085 [Pedobacter sp. V48]
MEINKIEQSIEVIDVERFHRRESTEEVQDIIERMPTKFAMVIGFILTFIFILLIFFGWFIRYPDIVKGKVTINSPLAPIKLVANSSGKVKLNSSMIRNDVKSGDVVAYIQSSTSYETLSKISEILQKYSPNNDDTRILLQLPSKVSLGELTGIYYNFYSSIYQLRNFQLNKLYEEQILSLQNVNLRLQDQFKNSLERVEVNTSSLKFTEKFLKRDSILFAKKVAAEVELDRAEMEYLNNKNVLAASRSELIEAGKQAEQTISKIKELQIQKEEKMKELKIAVVTTYNQLIENIASWEQRYVIRSPFDGKIQFLKFWTDNQFVQMQEPMFTIIPKTKEPYGQVSLTTIGAGKVKEGQEVIVKLDNYPYSEYGSIKGIVTSMSLTTSTERTPQGNIEAYLVTVKFPLGLRTNYGEIIPFRHETQGDAEIITNDRRLIERIIGKIKYAIRK